CSPYSFLLMTPPPPSSPLFPYTTLFRSLGWKLLNRGMHSPFFHNFHAGFAMLAHPWALLLGMTLRTSDLLVQAARFALAAKVVGVEMTWEGAILIATAFFVIGVMSPAGNLGTREG